MLPVDIRRVIDQRVKYISRPNGEEVTPGYNLANGRLMTLTTGRGTNGYGYDSNTGQLASISTLDGVGLTYGYEGSLLKDVTWSGPGQPGSAAFVWLKWAST